MTQRGDGKENKKLKLKRVSLDLDDDLWLTLRVEAAKRELQSDKLQLKHYTYG
jgi:hypothetical protein